MYKKIIIYIYCITLFTCISSCGIFTNRFSLSPQRTYTFDYWSLLVFKDQVYLSSFPITSSTVSKNRSLHYLMLVYNKLQKKYIISIVGGKNYANISEVIIKVNYNEYALPVSNDRAWLTNTLITDNLIEDMKTSNELIVLSSFEDKTIAIDTYSLKGFNEAIEYLPNIFTVN